MIDELVAILWWIQAALSVAAILLMAMAWLSCFGRNSNWNKNVDRIGAILMKKSVLQKERHSSK